ncbi:hypothetical protein Q3G72_006855 [Acer saccharum]|nr:hypothetical protein Q3G72_006855 [Acer saccharum]
MGGKSFAATNSAQNLSALPRAFAAQFLINVINDEPSAILWEISKGCKQKEKSDQGRRIDNGEGDPGLE